jgi:hypothetical protein
MFWFKPKQHFCTCEVSNIVSDDKSQEIMGLSCNMGIMIIIHMKESAVYSRHYSASSTVTQIQVSGYGTHKLDNKRGLTYEYRWYLFGLNNKKPTLNLDFHFVKREFVFSNDFHTVFFDGTRISFSREKPILLFMEDHSTVQVYDSDLFFQKFGFSLDRLLDHPALFDFMKDMVNGSPELIDNKSIRTGLE